MAEKFSLKWNDFNQNEETIAKLVENIQKRKITLGNMLKLTWKAFPFLAIHVEKYSGQVILSIFIFTNKDVLYTNDFRPQNSLSKITYTSKEMTLWHIQACKWT